MTSHEHRDIADRVRAARENAGISQRKLAARIGIPQPRLSRREKGEVEFRVSEVETIARILNVSVEALLSGEKATA